MPSRGFIVQIMTLIISVHFLLLLGLEAIPLCSLSLVSLSEA